MNGARQKLPYCYYSQVCSQFITIFFGGRLPACRLLATTLFGPNFLFYFAILTRRSNQPDWMSPHGDIFPASAAHPIPGKSRIHLT
jgi:hypothetical protein